MTRATRATRYPGVFSRDGGRSFSFRAQFGDPAGRWGVSGSGFGTKREAWDARNEAVAAAEAQRGRLERLEPSISVGDFLDVWLRGQEGTLRPASVAAYASSIKALRRQAIAAVPVRHVTDEHVRRLIGAMRSESIRHATLMGRLAVLRAALGAAVNRGLLRTNPAAGIRLAPTSERFRAQTWDAGTGLRFLSHCQRSGHPLYPAFRLGMVTGLRRGELLGLKWDDLDLDAGVLEVRRTRSSVAGRLHEGAPKTASSGAPVYLDAETCALLAQLPRVSDYVVTDPGTDGPYGRPATFFDHFRRACLAADVPAIRFHDLRHTAATLMAQAGVHLTVAQERLRHWSPEMTAQYTHAQAGAAREAADVMGALFTGDAETPAPALRIVS